MIHAMNDEDRRIDEQVALHVFGWRCAHDMRPVPAALVLADARAAFATKYGESPPPGWEPEEHEESCYCRSRLTRQQFEGYWCAKCGLRAEDLRHEMLGYWSRNLSYGWRVVDKMRERGHVRWMPRGLEAMSEEQAARAICVAALKAVGAEVPA